MLGRAIRKHVRCSARAFLDRLQQIGIGSLHFDEQTARSNVVAMAFTKSVPTGKWKLVRPHFTADKRSQSPLVVLLSDLGNDPLAVEPDLAIGMDRAGFQRRQRRATRSC